MDKITPSFFQANGVKTKPILFLLFLFLIGTQIGWGQQVIGSFPIVDGGFEGQTDGTLATVAATAPNATKWTSQSSAFIATITNNASASRSGSKYVSATLTSNTK